MDQVRSALGRSLRGGADVKLVLAMLFAVGGLSWGVISVMSSGKKDKPTQGLQVLNAAVDSEGNALETSFTKASSNRQVDSVKNEIQAAIADQVQTVLRSIDAPKGTPDGVSDATINAFVPLLSGDHDAFIQAIAAMGGRVPGDLEGDHPMFTHLAKICENAQVDVTRVTVERFVAREPRLMNGRQDRINQNEELQSSDTPGKSIQHQVMEMTPASLFPDAPAKQDPTAILVSIPVMPKGEKNESIFGVILTWNTAEKLWQPAAYQITRNRLVEDN